eukprot:677219-Rhodomonas_salina.1
MVAPYPLRVASQSRVVYHRGYGATLRNPIQATAISVQFVPGIRSLVIDFGVHAAAYLEEQVDDGPCGVMAPYLRPIILQAKVHTHTRQPLPAISK